MIYFTNERVSRKNKKTARCLFMCECTERLKHVEAEASTQASFMAPLPRCCHSLLLQSKAVTSLCVQSTWAPHYMCAMQLLKLSPVTQTRLERAEMLHLKKKKKANLLNPIFYASFFFFFNQCTHCVYSMYTSSSSSYLSSG